MICTPSRRKLFFTCIGSALIAAMSWSQAGAAPIVIPTNSNGADAEVRESDTAVGFDGVPLGTNRGGSMELATRVRDQVDPLGAADMGAVTEWFVANDRSSVMFLKFDISSLPGSGDPLWNDHNVHLRLTARQNGNFNNLFGTNPSNPAENVLLQFRLLGLEPGHVYADDNAAAADREDRLGNDYTNPEYKYNWSESAITFYNAPGITPHCMIQGSCLDPNIANSNADSVVQTLGIYDDFNSDARVLGTFLPPDPLVAGADLQVGQAIDYLDPDGNLKQLVFDAQAAGRGFVTLMLHIDMDGTKHQPNVGRPGTTPDGMLNRNYVVNPKEQIPLLLADPDSPYSAADNSTGAFSPQLLIRIPEPSSIVLMGLAIFAAAGSRRRRN